MRYRIVIEETVTQSFAHTVEAASLAEAKQQITKGYLHSDDLGNYADGEAWGDSTHVEIRDDQCLEVP